MIRAELLYIGSRCERPEFVDEKLFNPKEAPLIGCYAIDTINNEYTELSNSNITSIEYSDMCCEINYTFGLPCRHFILERLKKNESSLFPLMILKISNLYCKN